MTGLPRHDGLERLVGRIEDRTAVVGVVGLGYVGLPVAVTFSEAGFHTIGVDFDEAKVAALGRGESYLSDVDGERLGAATRDGRLSASTSYNALKGADAVLICVPTPLKEGAPDLSRVTSAGEALGELVQPGMLVVLESTTYPGTTEELLRPLLEASGLTAGKDFFLAFSPERIDPGNALYSFADIPKVVGGVDLASTNAAATLYGQVVPKVITVSSPKEAELTKLIENTFRHVNIALVNELAVYAHEMGIDIWESIEAAATKPFGFIPFWPGPGWGGHCIPLDPSYLSWRVRRDRSHEVRFVELAQAVNSEMPRHVVERTSLLLNDTGKAVRGARVLGVGVAYKSGTEDTRESPGMKVLDSLRARGAGVDYHDPLVPEIQLDGETLRSVALPEGGEVPYDIVLVLVPQEKVDWDAVVAAAPVVFDCCNALGKRDPRVVRL
ncbi:MAG TPA: nucleotide sugar dehydrogenase [Actinomycetota bacterium]|jgi:UDP-N-acetyl-D-glucosamine dehydrogenase